VQPERREFGRAGGGDDAACHAGRRKRRQEHATLRDAGPLGDGRRDLLVGEALGFQRQHGEVELVAVADHLEDLFLGHERACRTAAEPFEPLRAEFPAPLPGTEEGERRVVGREFDVRARRGCHLVHPRLDSRQPSGLDLCEQQPRLHGPRPLDAEVENGRVALEGVYLDPELRCEVDRFVDQLGRHPVETLHTASPAATVMKPWACPRPPGPVREQHG
jgi:hypothetical protein